MSLANGDDRTDSPASSNRSGGGLLTGGVILATLFSGIGKCARHAEHFAHVPRGVTRGAAEAFHMPSFATEAPGSFRLAPRVGGVDEVFRLPNVQPLRENWGSAAGRFGDDFANSAKAASIFDDEARLGFPGNSSRAIHDYHDPTFDASHLAAEIAKRLHHALDRDDDERPEFLPQQPTIWDNYQSQEMDDLDPLIQILGRR